MTRLPRTRRAITLKRHGRSGERTRLACWRLRKLSRVANFFVKRNYENFDEGAETNTRGRMCSPIEDAPRGTPLLRGGETDDFLFAGGRGRRRQEVVLDVFNGALDQLPRGIQAELAFDVFAVGLDRFYAQVHRVRDLFCAKPRTD
jgi:hypothetical protein